MQLLLSFVISEKPQLLFLFFGHKREPSRN